LSKKRGDIKTLGSKWGKWNGGVASLLVEANGMQTDQSKSKEKKKDSEFCNFEI
jgi:hypothetical protein